jgi:hypothetical protein
VNIVAAAVVLERNMKRLVDIADPMSQKLQRDEAVARLLGLGR